MNTATASFPSVASDPLPAVPALDALIADEIRKRGANAIKKEYLNYLFS